MRLEADMEELFSGVFKITGNLSDPAAIALVSGHLFSLRIVKKTDESVPCVRSQKEAVELYC